jgi:hypothetical protein
LRRPCSSSHPGRAKAVLPCRRNTRRWPPEVKPQPRRPGRHRAFGLYARVGPACQRRPPAWKASWPRPELRNPASPPRHGPAVLCIEGRGGGPRSRSRGRRSSWSRRGTGTHSSRRVPGRIQTWLPHKFPQLNGAILLILISISSSVEGNHYGISKVPSRGKRSGHLMPGAVLSRWWAGGAGGVCVARAFWPRDVVCQVGAITDLLPSSRFRSSGRCRAARRTSRCGPRPVPGGGCSGRSTSPLGKDPPAQAVVEHVLAQPNRQAAEHGSRSDRDPLRHVRTVQQPWP